MERLPFSRAEKILLISTVLLGGSILVLSRIYQQQNELPPAPPVEAQIPPSPNAFDFIVAGASQASVLAAPKYSRTTCIANGIDWEASCDRWKEPKSYTRAYDLKFPLSAKQGYLQANQKALQLWRQSLSMPLFVPKELSKKQSRAWWVGRGRIVGAVRTQARANWQNGDEDAALDWLLLWHQDACRSTLSFYNGRNHPSGFFTLNGSFDGRNLVMEELERLAPHLNAAQSRRAALKLQQNRALLPSRVEALQVTKTLRVEFARQVCQSNDLRRSQNFKRPETVEMDSVTQLRFRWANKKVGLKKLAAQWDWLITQVQLPLGQQEYPMPESLQISSSDPFDDLAGFSYSLSENQYAIEIDAREAVFLSALAARAFALKNGHNPRDLKELVPDYLRKIEVDPFNRQKGLVYSPKPKTYTLFLRGKPIFKLPLPKNATPVPTMVPAPTPSVGDDPLAFPMLPQPLAYLSSKTQKTLPFLLYSVGADGRDEGGMNYKQVASGNILYLCDDVLAPAKWFDVQEFEKQERDEQNARLFSYAPPAPAP